MKRFIHSLASPKIFFTWSNRLIPWLGVMSAMCILIALIQALWYVPPDSQQGNSFRILYVHVPSAFLSLLIYTMMGVYAFLFLVWRVKLADILHQASAPLGAGLTLLALITGALWGRPTWGTFWIWDARLTSELLLLFLYLGVIALRLAIGEAERAAQVSAVLTIIGLLDLPIIHYSVVWWHTLHQGSSIHFFSPGLIAFRMLWPLMLMIIGFIFYYLSVMLYHANTLLLVKERKTQWVKQYWG